MIFREVEAVLVGLHLAPGFAAHSRSAFQPAGMTKAMIFCVGFKLPIASSLVTANCCAIVEHARIEIRTGKLALSHNSGRGT